MSDHAITEQIVNNERLEFLGDAILDAVVAELLFAQFPRKNEGFLTEMRTRIVNREQLAYLASKLGLVEIMDIKRDLHQNRIALKTIGGNALEALIGAIYLDKGFKASRDFIVNRLVGQYLDLEKLMTTAVSHKALVMKWAQQQKKVFLFFWKFLVRFFHQSMMPCFSNVSLQMRSVSYISTRVMPFVKQNSSFKSSLFSWESQFLRSLP
jgi:dsRNA-specific ribonuclease